MYTEYDYNNELYHYGVKGMKWGVRKNPDVVNAKQQYKTAKKEYRKAYNKWYYSAPGFTDKQRHNKTKKLVDVYLKANDANIKRGELLKAKGTASNNSKKISKGKALVAMNKNNKAYNLKVKDAVNKGYSMGYVNNSLKKERIATVKRNNEVIAKYRRERYIKK